MSYLFLGQSISLNRKYSISPNEYQKDKPLMFSLYEKANLSDGDEIEIERAYLTKNETERFIKLYNR